jgi:peptidoglycan/LPS O-acetylase OafA/YrhL
VLLSVLVLGPLTTVLPLGEYAADGETWRYLRNLVMLPADGLAGVFGDVPYPGVVNGSLWTLRAEVICYAVVLLTGLLRGRWQTAGLVLFAVVSVPLSEGDVLLLGSSLSAAAGTWVYFAVAGLARLHLPRRALRLDVAAGALLLWAVVAATGGETWSIRASWLVLPYVVLTVGLRGWPVVRRTARFGDLSYGLYLFAFPVQQVLLLASPEHPLVVDLVVVTGISLLLAYASWHLVERPALDLRRLVRRPAPAGEPSRAG